MKISLQLPITFNILSEEFSVFIFQIDNQKALSKILGSVRTYSIFAPGLIWKHEFVEGINKPCHCRKKTQPSQMNPLSPHIDLVNSLRT